MLIQNELGLACTLYTMNHVSVYNIHWPVAVIVNYTAYSARCTVWPFHSNLQVSILVTDINDNIPVFPTDNLNISISESLPVDTAVLNLVATDNDFGSNAQLVYSIVLEESSAGVLTDGMISSLNMFVSVL